MLTQYCYLPNVFCWKRLNSTERVAYFDEVCGMMACVAVWQSRKLTCIDLSLRKNNKSQLF